MPLYEYECSECGKRTELLQRYADPPLAACPECGGPVKKLISSPSFQFKGTGWYATDYAAKKAPAEGGGGGGAEKAESGGGADSAAAASGKKEGGGDAKSAGEGGKTAAAPAAEKASSSKSESGSADKSVATAKPAKPSR